jgi:hypothetical protein
MVIFKFKQTNQEATPHYHPLAPATNDTAWAVVLGPALTRALLPTPTKRYTYGLPGPPRQSTGVVALRALTVTPRSGGYHPALQPA